MRSIAGAILILGGAILIGAGIIAHEVGTGRSSHAEAGYILGGLLAVVGITILVAGPLKRGWDAIPVDEKKPRPRDPEG